MSEPNELNGEIKPILEQPRQTIGSLSLDLQQKDPGNHTVTEQMYENLTDYERNVQKCIAEAKKSFHDAFYVVVITKKERLMQNVIRNYFFARHSCPTPDYDQTVYKYTPKKDQIEFLWVIPSRDTCFLLLENRGDVAPSEYALLQYVLKFHDQTLFKLAQSLNNEIPNVIHDR